MGSTDRSLSDVLQDIVRNVQEIVRSEVRLAKIEFREEAMKAKSSVALLAAGGIAGTFAVFFLLLAVLYALALVMPSWAAALVVGVSLAGMAGVMLTVGVARVRQIHPIPERTVQTIKETAEWAKQQVK